jgi:hypothetical protein
MAQKYRNSVHLATAVLLYSLSSVGFLAKLATWLVVWFFTGGKHWMYISYHTLDRDLK